MSIVKKYLFYKRVFFICNIFNVFFIVFGIFGLIHYARNQDISGLELGVVGAGTLVFGVIGPLVIYQLMKRAAFALRKETEVMVAQWIAGWLENYRTGQEDGVEPTREPYFWLSIILMTVELFGEKSNHPVAKVVGEFAPLLKAELHRQTKSSGKKEPGEPKAPGPRRPRKTRETD